MANHMNGAKRPVAGKSVLGGAMIIAGTLLVPVCFHCQLLALVCGLAMP